MFPVYLAACSAPTIDAQPTSPTTADLAITPPSSGGPWTSFNVKLCPQSGGSCITTTCADPNKCAASGLTPFTTYAASVVAVGPGGATSPVSAPSTFTTSPTAAPTLSSTDATSPTTGTATATPPPGVTYSNYTFTAVPLNGGPPVTVTSTSPIAAFTGLTPGTQASVHAGSCRWLHSALLGSSSN